MGTKIEVPLFTRGNEEIMEWDTECPPDPDDAMQVLFREKARLKIWIELAMAYYKQSKEENLELLLERCQTVQPLPEDRTALGRIYDILAVHYTRKGRAVKNREKRRELFGKAAALLTQADKILGFEAYHLLARAYHCFVEGKTEQASTQFDFVLQSDSTCVAAMLGKACIEFNRKDSKAALQLYRKALQLNPNCPADVRLGIGHCFYRLNMINRAEQAFDRALAIDPKCVGALVGLACNELNKRTHESIRRGVMMLEKAYRIDAKDPMVLILLSDHYFRSKNIKGTLVLARRAFENTEDEAMQAESCFQLARAYHFSEDYTNAFEFYYKATQFASPKFVLPQYGLGQMYIQRREFENAIQCFEAVLKVVPNNYESMKILGSLYARSNNAEKRDQAKVFFKTCSEQRPNDHETWIELASLLEANDSKGALGAYQKALSIYEERSEQVPPEIYNNIAALCFSSGKLNDAQNYYSLALKRCEESMTENEQHYGCIIYTIKYNIGRLYEAQHNTNMAEKTYKDILKQHPNYVDCYLRLGCTERDRGQIFEASDRFKEALRVEQDHPDAWSLIGNLHLAKLEWGPGQKKFERIIEKNKENPDVYSLIAVGNIWLQNIYQVSRDKEKVKKHRDRALQFYKAALRQDPKNIWAACGVGCVLANKGLLNEARDVFSQVREATADFPDVWINIAHIYVEQSQYVAAVQMYENCLKKFHLHPDTEIMLYISRAYYKGNMLSDCKNTLLRARRIAPTDVVILYNLAMVLRRLAAHILFNPKSTLRMVLTAVDELHIAHGYFVYMEKLNDNSKLNPNALKSEIRACLDLLQQATYHVTKAKQAYEEEKEARRKALEESAALEAMKHEQDLLREESSRKRKEELDLKRKEHLKRQEETKTKILEEPEESEDRPKRHRRQKSARRGKKRKASTSESEPESPFECIGISSINYFKMLSNGMRVMFLLIIILVHLEGYSALQGSISAALNNDTTGTQRVSTTTRVPSSNISKTTTTAITTTQTDKITTSSQVNPTTVVDSPDTWILVAIFLIVVVLFAILVAFLTSFYKSSEHSDTIDRPPHTHNVVNNVFVELKPQRMKSHQRDTGKIASLYLTPRYDCRHQINNKKQVKTAEHQHQIYEQQHIVRNTAVQSTSRGSKDAFRETQSLTQREPTRIIETAAKSSQSTSQPLAIERSRVSAASTPTSTDGKGMSPANVIVSQLTEKSVDSTQTLSSQSEQLQISKTEKTQPTQHSLNDATSAATEQQQSQSSPQQIQPQIKRKQADIESEAITRSKIKANDYASNSQFAYADNYIKTSKYTLLTFLPYNLFEQFRRLANTYFLCLLILQLIPQISSLTPVTTAVPLIVVLAITAIKDAHDDICRHQNDNQVNNRLSLLLADGQLLRERWHKVKVGDIIRIENDQFVAADLMILSTSEPNGFCYVETAELDGETNLKCRQSLAETAALGDNIEALAAFNGEIICETPNNNLTKFEGTLYWQGQKFAIDNDKMLLRGCILRNTKWCFGLVIFAGRDTKLMQNSGKTIFKRTKSDRLLNILIMGIVLALLSMCLFSSLACTVWELATGRYFHARFLPREIFIPHWSEFWAASVTGILTFFSYLIVLNTVVPISLYVSVEVIRYCQSLLIDFDAKMYYEPKGAYAKARTTTLNEELGQVEYVFSDKTGTLTQNLMTFNKCTIDGVMYGEVYDPVTDEPVEITSENFHLFDAIDFSWNSYYEEDFKFYDARLLDQVRAGDAKVHEFFRLLALCHTVMSEVKPDGKLEYQAQSPDEAALSAAARNFGFVFKARTSSTIEIEVLGQNETYELLAILDFNNVRKRMSVIVRGPNNKITLYCKGADSVIYEHLDSGCDSLKATTNEHLDRYAGVGLRTLCLAKKDLDEQQYEQWQITYHNASTAIEDREHLVNECYEQIEQNLQLLGATAIEDKLQDDVPKTIANLIAANIKVWVLTGDKQETAINIGYSCELLTDEMVEIFVVDGCYPEEVDKQLRKCKKVIAHTPKHRSRRARTPTSKVSANNNINNKANINRDDHYNHIERQNDIKLNRNKETLSRNTKTGGFALVISGHSLAHALCPSREKLFLHVACCCKSVICCRVTPLQKALVVDLVKRHKRVVTLSIGDGANDVSMLKMAHIGVGISGQEGMQAVLASDYSIAQFAYLERLLLVHGRWSYFRMCKFLRYFFYKNFSFTLCNLWYAFFCGFSAQVLLALGIFDQDVNDRFSTRYPLLYTPGHVDLLFNKHEFIKSVAQGIITSFTTFFVTWGVFMESVDSEGVNLDGHELFGCVVSTNLVVVVTAQAALDTSYWTVFNHIVIWGSIAFFFAMTLVFNSRLIRLQYLGVFRKALSTPLFWFTLFLVLTLLLVPVVAYRFYRVDVHPTLADRCRYIQRASRRRTRPITPQFRRRSSTRKSRRSIHSGYAFSHAEGFGNLITSGMIIKKSDVEHRPPSSGGATAVAAAAAASSAVPPAAGVDTTAHHHMSSSIKPGQHLRFDQ
ncbi:putative phospholipid-transporting ATPase IM [Fragariocoptes setiger]|uniref:P-type phospholipid transporter n=1 Tax=Fragariocoptes setiger TaxID=1670756 RepID=A0ABQ7SCN1_9ACAR|nr:putative phospholipid-transporting ATPase IM [Fragariocoptes setiger]